MGRRTLVALLILGCVPSGCDDRAVESLDLIPLAQFGLWRNERSQIPVDREDVPEFGEGWTRSRNAPGGKHFRWASDSVSILNLLCVEPRDLELQMVARPFTWKGAPPQSVTVELNGTELGSWGISGPTTLRIPLPAVKLRPGDNTILFSWAYAQRASEVLPRKGSQRRAVAVTDLVVAGLGEKAPSDRPVPAHDSLSFPPGSQLTIAVWAGEGAWLEVESGAGSNVGLQVWARREGEDLTLRWTSDGRGDARRLRLGGRAGPVEIVFRAPGSLANASRIVKRAQVGWPSAATPLPTPSAKAVTRPDILLYVVDTLRADRLSCYGGPPGISPALDGLASDGVLFENAVAQSSWTKPSMVSVLSGLLTTEHGVRQREPKIPREVTLIAEFLQSAGYRTGAFTTNAYLVKAAGFDRGFDTFEYAPEGSGPVTRRALDWFGAVADDGPVFLWIHTIDPHAPYEPEQPFRARWAADIPDGVGSVDHIRSLATQRSPPSAELRDEFLALYDAEVAQNDASLGLALNWLKERGRYWDSLVVFLSDHGEEFWEHGVNGHGWDLFEEVLHVPMVIKPAGWESGGRRRGDTVEHVDLVPTLLAAAGLEAPEKLQGRDLLAEMQVDPGGRVTCSEMTYKTREGLSVRWGEYKLIVPQSRGFLPQSQLFDLVSDPYERRPVTDRPVTAAWLALEGRRCLDRLSSAPRAEDSVELNETTREALEALGYLDPSEEEDE